MVRILYERIFDNGLKYIKGACVDADVATLPTAGFVTGSKLVCADSGDVYMFAEGDSPAWNKVRGTTAGE